MADEQTTTSTSNSTETPEKQLVLQKIYVKDLSFESPKAPGIFATNVSPQMQLDIRSDNQDIGGGNVEVSLTLTVASKDKDDTLFLIEICQAGIFMIEGYTSQERSALIGSFCPNTLYPFAREAVADIATKGGFPQLLLQPINFDALYTQAVQERVAQTTAGGTAEAATAPETGEPH